MVLWAKVDVSAKITIDQEGAHNQWFIQEDFNYLQIHQVQIDQELFFLNSSIFQVQMYLQKCWPIFLNEFAGSIGVSADGLIAIILFFATS